MHLRSASLLALITFAVRVFAADATADDAQAAAVGRAFLKYQEQLRTALPKPEANPLWWKTTSTSGIVSGETREKLNQIENEFRATVRPLLGGEVLSSIPPDTRFAFLPTQKQEAVARIDRTYSLRVAELRQKTGTSVLPADLERFRGFAADRERDLKTILTPAEFEEFDMRTSTSGQMLRSRYGEAIESLDEFRKLFVLQKAFDEKYPMDSITGANINTVRARSDAERKLVDDLIAAVGPARAKAFRRAADQEYVTLKSLARRMNLPDTVPDAVLELRENYAGVSMAINAQTGVSTSDRRALIQEVEKEARQKLTDLLGKDAFDAYVPRAYWLRYLGDGMAYSTDPKDSPLSSSSSLGVYLVPPSGTVLRSASGTTVIGGSTSAPPAPASPANEKK